MTRMTIAPGIEKPWPSAILCGRMQSAHTKSRVSDKCERFSHKVVESLLGSFYRGYPDVGSFSFTEMLQYSSHYTMIIISVLPINIFPMKCRSYIDC